MHGAIYFAAPAENPDGLLTTFQSGATINVSFHLAYPHRVCALQDKQAELSVLPVFNQHGIILHACIFSREECR